MSTLLKHLHADMAEAFTLHRECLVGLDLLEAQERLEIWIRDLRGHIQAEESRLLPIYRERVLTPPRGGSPQLFRDEHHKIERLLAELEAFMATLVADRDHPRIRRGVLQLIERELTLAHVLEHHDLREEQILVPALTEQIDAGELEEILGAVAEQSGRPWERRR